MLPIGVGLNATLMVLLKVYLLLILVGENFMNEVTDCLGSFSNFLGDGNSLYTNLFVAMTVVEARERKWDSLWI